MESEHEREPLNSGCKSGDKCPYCRLGRFYVYSTQPLVSEKGMTRRYLRCDCCDMDAHQDVISTTIRRHRKRKTYKLPTSEIVETMEQDSTSNGIEYR